MPKVSFAFFATAAAFALSGMILGMWMGSQENFTFAPVHAHINLIGWTGMALMGGFFALCRDRAPMRLAWISYGLTTAGVLGMAPALAAILVRDVRFMPLLIASELAVFASMIVFLVAVMVTWRRTYGRPTAPALGATVPAE